MTLRSERSTSIQCPWCNEMVVLRKDGAMRVHKWLVWYDADTGDPVKDTCIGSGLTEAKIKEIWT